MKTKKKKNKNSPANSKAPTAERTKPAEESTKKQPFLKRLLFGEERPDLMELEAGSTTILDILSPTTVNTKSRDYIVVDGVFHAYLYITGYGYATTVGASWLAPLVEAGEGVSLSFRFDRQSKEKILSKISQQTMLNRSRMREVADTRQDFEELDSAIHAGMYLKDVMNRQGEDFYYMHTLIEVTANDPETLELRITAVEKLCVSVDMIARRCDYKNEQAFLSALPILYLDPDIERKSRRNALTSGVAAAFPFASYELSDRDGIFLGLNMYNRSPVFLNPYDDYKYTNGNVWIGGSSGAGKTFTLQCIGGRLRQQGKRVIYIIPKKGHEFRPRCEQLGGLYLRMSPSSRDCPNLMAIRRKSLDSYAGLKNLSARDDSVLADKISRLIIWYSLQKKDLSDEDRNYLDTSLVECYRRYGITFDNASVLTEDGQFREMPVLADWYQVLQESPDTKHLAVVLARYVTGSASAMGGRNEVDLDNKYIVIDTSGMPDDLLLPGIFWATDLANDLISNAGGSLSALISDELWSLVGTNSNPLAAGYIQEMVKTIRGLGGIAITSTQGMQDLFSLDNGKYGNFCLDEYCNIGYLDGIADSLNSIRGFNMSCQVVVQSLSQWQERYPGKAWENHLATFDQTLYMGCNDITSAKYISEKCGKVTISVVNNQMPLMPLFSPVYTSTRPYSQTRSNTSRDLMQTDEVLRLDNRKCLVLFKGHKPALLYKIAPEELPDYAGLQTCRVIDYIPEWRKQNAKPPKPPATPQPAQTTPPPAQSVSDNSDMDDLGMVELPRNSIYEDTD